jgi:tRNA (adenine37-N6)-methyltransferase
MSFTVREVGVVHSSRREPLDDHWDAERMTIELAEDVPAESLEGLATFSHVEVLFLADRAHDVPPDPWIRHPRGNESWPLVGVFANRNKDRPNRILNSVAALVSISGRTIEVTGLDAIDGTPVLDIKPYYRWSGPRGEVRAPEWSDELGRAYFS